MSTKRKAAKVVKRCPHCGRMMRRKEHHGWGYYECSCGYTEEE